ncbi:hypothetical protein [Tepidicella baoligensis]|uniref:hypothetical protein n=1 Tax=Tepidicella baoligensis TaxID=2707016 RepID=UPI001FE2EE71|nr:hypothetical protein [Tepidicella baoligensis]
MRLLPYSSLAPVWTLLALGVVSMSAVAQGQIWRCGNEYTNNPGPQPEARGCRVLEGGNLTIVESGRAPLGASSAASSPGATPAARSTAPTGARDGSERVSRTEQQARDRDARFILETEWRRAQERLAQLQTEYNQGQPERLPSEQGDERRYRERSEELKRRLERAQADVIAIERELERLPVTPR